MQGSLKAIAVRDLQGGIALPNAQAGFNAVNALCGADSKAISASLMKDHLRNIEFINQAISKGGAKPSPYEGVGEVPYPNSDPGVGLRSIARLIEAKVGLQYAWVDQSSEDGGLPYRLRGQGRKVDRPVRRD